MTGSLRKSVRFWLNDELVELFDLPPTQTLLDFLRLEKRFTGTKEGCAEGDCGACTILVGRLSSKGLVYESVTACIRFVASLDGCHVVSIEHLRGAGGQLHPVQQALVDHHGSQCGFCTPGIVMSLYALWMENASPGVDDIEEALQGNLCRCTGYAPIVRAAFVALKAGGQGRDVLVAERADMVEKLKALQDNRRVEIRNDEGGVIVPADVDDLAEVLVENPHATIVAGATDVGLWVTKHMQEISPVVFVGHLKQLRMIVEGDDAVSIGAGVTYTDFMPVIAGRFPQLRVFWSRIGGRQVRNMGTIGGNIANGSPIGDTPPALIALGAAITLRKGEKRRFVRLEDYFIAYGKQDRSPGEFIESISIPYPGPGEHLAVYKVSKRRDEDISALCGAFRLRLGEDNRVSEISVVFGGMAAIPKRAAAVEKALLGKEWNEANVSAALPAFGEDYQPLSDVRASAAYRMLAAQNLLRRFYLETIGQADELKRGTA